MSINFKFIHHTVMMWYTNMWYIDYLSLVVMSTLEKSYRTIKKIWMNKSESETNKLIFDVS